jgi:lipopolysaccharide export system permease protein
MRILDRYLVNRFALSLLYCLCLFSVLFIVIDIFNNLDEFLKSGVHLKIILTYYLYSVPVILVQIVPMAVLVSTLYVLGSLSRHNEITAMRASGVSSFHILAPYLFIGAVISFTIFLVSERVVPLTSVTSTSIMEGLIEKGKKTMEERSIQNATLFTKGNRMVYAREYELATDTLYDIVLFEDDPHRLMHTKVAAKKGVYKDGRWRFYETIEYHMDRRGELEGEPRFSDSMTIALEAKPEDFLRESLQIEYMNTQQLDEYIRHLRSVSRKLVQKMRVDFHYKIAFPFVSFIVMLIGAPLAMRSERGGTLKGIGTSLGVVMLYYGINSIALALGKGGALPPVFSAWFSNLFFASVGLYLIRKSA